MGLTQHTNRVNLVREEVGRDGREKKWGREKRRGRREGKRGGGEMKQFESGRLGEFS